MAKKEEKDELEDVETTPRAQAAKEMQEAAKNVREKGSHRTPKANKHEEEEEEEVTPATRARAQEELREAVRRVREGQKKSAGDKSK